MVDPERMSVVKIMQRSPRPTDPVTTESKSPVEEIPLNRGPIKGEVVFARRPLRISPPFVPKPKCEKPLVTTETVAAVCHICKCLYICDKDPGPDFACGACMTVTAVTDFLFDDDNFETLDVTKSVGMETIL